MSKWNVEFKRNFRLEKRRLVMILKSKSLKHLAMAGFFGVFLLFGMSTAANA